MQRKHPGGRPRFNPTDDQRKVVLVMKGHDIDQETIALALEIDTKTLRRHFRKELNQAAGMILAQLTGKQFKRAMGDDSVAQRATEFILSTRFGFKKTEALELSGPNGKPIETTEITDERRAKALANFIARTKS